MAKREISSTLKNLKFMQRAVQKEEKPKKEVEVKPANDFPSSSASKRCVVIFEGDPHPAAIRGRMSFLSFNPSIDKLNEEAANVTRPEASPTNSGGKRDKSLTRENGTAQDGSQNLEADTSNGDADEDLKRKHADASETQYPSKSPKNFQESQQSSPSRRHRSPNQQKREKLDWSVLQPPKPQKNKK